MSKKQFLLTLLLAVISAFLGGMLGVRFLMPPSVLAQEDSTEERTIEAERFVLKDTQGRIRAELSMLFEHPTLQMYNVEGETYTLVGEGVMAVYRDGILGEGSIFIDGGLVPSIRILDNEGFEAVLGSTSTVETRTGRTNQTSAASLILFGKDKKVVWSAP